MIRTTVGIREITGDCVDKKIQNLSKQFARQVECARLAGIYEHFFIAFGSLLGYARNGAVIPHDDDMDIGIVADKITAEQEQKYFTLLEQPTMDFPGKGLFEYRKEHTRWPNGRFYWISIRAQPIGQGLKCCNWFFYSHAGIAWHTKGPGSLIKGMPGKYLELGEEVEFLGTTVKIPKYTGACLDWWYDDWATPRVGGTSSKRCLMTVNNWNVRSNWKISCK